MTTSSITRSDQNWSPAGVQVSSSPAHSSSAAGYIQAGGRLEASTGLASRAVSDSAPRAGARRPQRGLPRWRAIPGWEGLYEASRFGQIRSVPRVVRYRDGRVRTYLGQMIKPRPVKGGYLSVNLAREGCQETHKVHKLVALTFHGAPPPGLEVRHYDGDQKNNRATNLIYGTRSENIHDQVRHGRHARAQQVTCLLGHSLVAPNLVMSVLRKEGRRNCLACVQMHRAASRAKTAGRPFDRKAEADRRYIEIMRRAAA